MFSPGLRKWAAIIQYTCNGVRINSVVTTNTNGSVRLTARQSGKSWRRTKGGTADGRMLSSGLAGAAYQQFQPATGEQRAEASADDESGEQQRAARRAGGTTVAANTAQGTPDAGGTPEQAERWTQRHHYHRAAPGHHQWWRDASGARPQAEFRLAWRLNVIGLEMLLWLQAISTLPTEQRRSVWKARSVRLGSERLGWE